MLVVGSAPISNRETGVLSSLRVSDQRGVGELISISYGNQAPKGPYNLFSPGLCRAIRGLPQEARCSVGTRLEADGHASHFDSR